MRIAFVSGGLFGSDSIGGAERQIGELARALAARGHDVTLVSRLSENVGACDEVPGVRHVQYRTSGARRLAWTDSVYSAIAEVEPEVIYQRGLSVLTRASARYARESGCGFVFAAASDADADRVSERFSRAVRELREPHNRRNWLRAIARGAIETRAHATLVASARSAGVVIAQSARQGRALSRRLGRSEGAVAVVPSVYPEPQESTWADRGVVLWVGADKPIKRPWLFEEIARRGPVDFRYIMVGRRIGSSGRYGGDGVEALDVVPPDEVTRLMRQAVVFVNTSEAEGFPNTYLEAWACGTPVLSLGVDPDGVVERDALGWVCGSVEEASAVLCTLADDPGVARTAGERCFHHALNMYDAADAVLGVERALETARAMCARDARRGVR